MNTTTLLILSGLAVWRLTHLLHAESGPGQMFEQLRDWAGASVLGEALGCFYCLSLWVALPLALFIAEPWGERLITWLALSAVAILLERITARRDEPALASYVEELPEAPLPDPMPHHQAR